MKHFIILLQEPAIPKGTSRQTTLGNHTTKQMIKVLGKGGKTFELCSEDGRHVVRFGAKNRGLCIREVLESWQFSDDSITGDPNRIAKQVTRQVALECLARVKIPILFSGDSPF